MGERDFVPDGVVWPHESDIFFFFQRTDKCQIVGNSGGDWKRGSKPTKSFLWVSVWTTTTVWDCFLLMRRICRECLTISFKNINKLQCTWYSRRCSPHGESWLSSSSPLPVFQSCWAQGEMLWEAPPQPLPFPPCSVPQLLNSSAQHWSGLCWSWLLLGTLRSRKKYV